MGRPPHRLPVRVYYEDTDFSGVVYHANYLRFLERGRTELLRSAGVDQSILHAEPGGIIFAVRRMSLEYVRPARMDDLLTIETETSEIRGASLRMSQRILREDIVLLTAEVHVAVLAGGRPARLPDEIRRLLQGDDP
jgi:acyl-CoA thioester hydrolase